MINSSFQNTNKSIIQKSNLAMAKFCCTPNQRALEKTSPSQYKKIAVEELQKEPSNIHEIYFRSIYNK